MRQGNRVRVLILPRLVLGLLLVLLGIALTLDQLGVVEVHHAWRYWPAALILIGLSRLQRSEGRRPAQSASGGGDAGAAGPGCSDAAGI
jgi:hypothetical protein